MSFEMPRISRNGKPETKQPETRIGRLLKERIASIKVTDQIEIGSENVSPDDLKDIKTSSMTDVIKRMKGIRYLVPNWIPLAMVTMIVAEPGIGKSAFALYALMRVIVTGGLCWFGGVVKGPAKAGFVLLCDTEGTAAINSQRIKDWGIPTDRIKVPFEDELQSFDLTDETHLERMLLLIIKYKIMLVIIDSLRGAHDGDENSSKIASTLKRLTSIAEETGAAIIIIHHTRKLHVDEELNANSSRGSNAILAMVRSQLGIDKPDPESDWCRLQMLKENLGLKPKPIGFLITSQGLEFGPAPEKPIKEKRETGKDRAEQWLMSRMEPGEWYLESKLSNEAEALGFSKTGTLQKARESLGIVKPDCVKKVGKHIEWMIPVPGGKKDDEIETTN